MRRTRFVRTIGVMLLLFILATAMYAFTADNTIADSKAGHGEGDVSGYDVSNITYTFAEDRTIIATVQFDLDAPAENVYARFNADGAWATCTDTVLQTADAYRWSCPVNASAHDAETLEVSAAE